MSRDRLHSLVDLVRILTKLINTVLTGPMSRNNHANQILKELFTNHCHLRYDEISVIVEQIFKYLNHDEDDASNLNRNLYQLSIKVKLFERKILFN